MRTHVYILAFLNGTSLVPRGIEDVNIKQHYQLQGGYMYVTNRAKSFCSVLGRNVQHSEGFGEPETITIFSFLRRHGHCKS